MSFIDNLARDLDQVFFNTDEFADGTSHSSGMYRGIFMSKSEVVLDGVVTYVPSVTLKSSDSANIANGDTVSVNGKPYTVVDRVSQHTDIETLYLSTDSRRMF